MKSKLCKFSVLFCLCALCLLGFKLRWIYLPTGLPIPVLWPKQSTACLLWHKWHQAFIRKPASLIWQQ